MKVKGKEGDGMSNRNWALFHQVDVADTFGKRLKGWMGKKKPQSSEGLLLIPCKSIHTLFMKFPIDVLFIDPSGKVIHLIEQMKPWRFSPVIQQSAAVLELVGGSVAESGIRLGDRVIELPMQGSPSN